MDDLKDIAAKKAKQWVDELRKTTIEKIRKAVGTYYGEGLKEGAGENLEEGYTAGYQGGYQDALKEKSKEFTTYNTLTPAVLEQAFKTVDEFRKEYPDANERITAFKESIERDKAMWGSHFGLTPEQMKKVDEWKQTLPLHPSGSKTGMSGVRLRYCFTPSTIGTYITVEDVFTDVKLCFASMCG